VKAHVALFVKHGKGLLFKTVSNCHGFEFGLENNELAPKQQCLSKMIVD
jgi:hypothetical protein